MYSHNLRGQKRIVSHLHVNERWQAEKEHLVALRVQ